MHESPSKLPVCRELRQEKWQRVTKSLRNKFVISINFFRLCRHLFDVLLLSIESTTFQFIPIFCYRNSLNSIVWRRSESSRRWSYVKHTQTHSMLQAATLFGTWRSFPSPMRKLNIKHIRDSLPYSERLHGLAWITWPNPLRWFGASYNINPRSNYFGTFVSIVLHSTFYIRNIVDGGTLARGMSSLMDPTFSGPFYFGRHERKMQPNAVIDISWG